MNLFNTLFKIVFLLIQKFHHQFMKQTHFFLKMPKKYYKIGADKGNASVMNNYANMIYNCEAFKFILPFLKRIIKL